MWYVRDISVGKAVFMSILSVSVCVNAKCTTVYDLPHNFLLSSSFVAIFSFTSLFPCFLPPATPPPSLHTDAYLTKDSIVQVARRIQEFYHHIPYLRITEEEHRELLLLLESFPKTGVDVSPRVSSDAAGDEREVAVSSLKPVHEENFLRVLLSVKRPFHSTDWH